MKNNIKLIIALSALALIASACSFTTANISSFNFGKNDKANPPATTFNVGEKIYAVATVSNAMGKYKLKYKIMTPSATAPVEKDLSFEGNYQAFLDFTPNNPGDYKVEVILSDESGKEIDKKSGTATVKGSAPAPAPAETKKDDAGADESHSDDKPHNN